MALAKFGDQLIILAKDCIKSTYSTCISGKECLEWIIHFLTAMGNPTLCMHNDGE